MPLADQLTLARIACAPIVVILFTVDFVNHDYWGTVVFCIAMSTDWFDGRIARRRGHTSPLGTLLDPVADKLLVAAALIALVQIEMIDAWVAVVIIGRELAVTGLRGVALSMGALVPASGFGKAKTVSQYIAITILILDKGAPGEFLPFHLVSTFVLWVALALTVLSGADYFYRFFLSTGVKALVKDRERWP